jgi:hypothetical protein
MAQKRLTDFMKLPLAERRNIMKKQAEQMGTYYNKTAVEREEWQGGDFIDSLSDALETTATRNKKR